MKKRVLFIILTFIIIMPLAVKAKSCTACNLEKDVTSKVACLKECTGTTVSSSTTTTSTVGQKCSNCEKIPSSADRSACLKSCVDDTSSSSSSSSTSSSSTSTSSSSTSSSAISSAASQLTEKGKELQTSYNEYQELVNTCASMSGNTNACSASPNCEPETDGTCVPKKAKVTTTTVTASTTGDHSFSSDETIKACGIDMPAKLPHVTSTVYDIVKVIVPIVIIVLGMLDFIKAVMSSSEDKAKKQKEIFIRRLIAGVSVFFIMVLVEFVFNHVDVSEKNGMISCMKCILSNNSCGDTSSGTSLSKTCSDYSESDCPNMIGKDTVYIMCAPHDGKCVLDCDRLSLSQCSSHQDICKYDNGGCAFR